MRPINHAPDPDSEFALRCIMVLACAALLLSAIKVACVREGGGNRQLTTQTQGGGR